MVTGVLFGLAILAFAVRTYIRIRILKQFSTEDYFLLFAVLCLCATTGLTVVGVQNVYDSLALILHGAGDTILFEILRKIPKISREENAVATLVWLVIFPVKLAFLFFFRRLINRLRNLTIWWWCVMVFTIPAGLSCIAASWVTCPYTSIEKVLGKYEPSFSNPDVAHCQSSLACSGPSANYRVVRDVSITTVMEVLTDILVVSVPIALLWKVRITASQKIGLAGSLCLSLVMAIVAIVRISGIKLAGSAVDIVWLAFWQQQEASIAVIMVSVSAFRTLFVANPSNSPSPRSPGSPRYWKKRILQNRPGFSVYDGSHENEPQKIPRATLTGMRTVIQRVGMSTVSPSDGDFETLVSSPRNAHNHGTPLKSDGEELGIELSNRVDIV